MVGSSSGGSSSDKFVWQLVTWTATKPRQQVGMNNQNHNMHFSTCLHVHAGIH
jgi:hypothetical protein